WAAGSGRRCAQPAIAANRPAARYGEARWFIRTLLEIKGATIAPPVPPRRESTVQRYANCRVLATVAATLATSMPKKATVMRAKKAVNMVGSVGWAAIDGAT